MTDRERAFEVQDYLEENGISQGDILSYIINHYLSGAEALEALQSAKDEFLDGD